MKFGGNVLASKISHTSFCLPWVFPILRSSPSVIVFWILGNKPEILTRNLVSNRAYSII